MKKIPTLFEREIVRNKVVDVLPIVKPGLEWVLDGEGEATEKVDGAACAIINGEFWKRYDLRPGRNRPTCDMIPCQPEPDPVTGHWPHWMPVVEDRREDCWFVRAYVNSPWVHGVDGTYEAVGKHFQSNPYGLDDDYLEPHGRIKIKDCPRTYEGIKEYLRTHEIEGIVFWKDGQPRCKIKRSDFGFEWPVKHGEDEE